MTGLAVAGAATIVAAGCGPATARTIVQIADTAPVYVAPGGAFLQNGPDLVLEHGSAWVIQRDGPWLGIRTLAGRSSPLGWIRLTPARRLMQTALLVTVDLSDRRVRVTSGGLPVMVARVAIGAPSSPTPVGETSVLQRIRVTPSSGYSRREYGPVIVALRLWQPIPSPAYPAGGIVAFHGGGGTVVGGAVSGGCLRMRDDDLEQLAEIVRAGTPVIIHR